MMACFECGFLLLTLFARVLTTKISVHRGESVLLFQNVDTAKKEIALYLNGDKRYTNIITWTIKNGTITPHFRGNYTKIFMDSDRNIWISNVDENYKGKYSIHNSTYSEVELWILVPLSVEISDLMITATQGQSVMLTCTVTGLGNITVIWIGLNGAQLFTNYKYTVGTYDTNSKQSNLTIKSLTASDTGTYTCRATDSSGTQKDKMIMLKVIPEVPLKVFIVNGKAMSRPVGSNATITCSVSGSGTKSVVWIGPLGHKLINSEKNSTTLISNNTGNSVLTIVLSSADSGFYTCQATDGFGFTKQDYIFLTAYVPLSVSIDSGNIMNGVNGGSITITCSVLGTGTITVTWIDPRGNIIINGPKYTMSSYSYNTEKDSLTIKSLNTSDSGNYTCQASDSRKTKLEDSISLTIAVFTAVINEATLSTSVGDNKVINCSVTGSYQSINWYQENTLLTNGQKYQISQTTSSGSTLSSLTIFSVQYSDAALYACQAVSSIDGVTIASDSVTVSVEARSHLDSKDVKTYIPVAIISFLFVVIIIIMAVYFYKCYKRKNLQQESPLQEEICLTGYKGITD